MKKTIKKTVKKVSAPKSVWDKKTDEAIKKIKALALKHKNVTIFICTQTKEKKGTGSASMLHNMESSLPISVASFLLGVKKNSPLAVELGLMKYLSHKK
jgi:hypothetical protein